MDRIVVPCGYNDSVPVRRVLFEVSIPTEEWLATFGESSAYTRAFAVGQCSPMEQIAEVIYGGPVEWVDCEEGDGYWRPAHSNGEKP